MDEDDRDQVTRRAWDDRPGGGGRTVATSDDPDQVKRTIEELNLDRVRDCGVSKYAWPYPAQAVRRYRDFLWVCWHRRDGTEPLAAISLLADQVWHCHMEDRDRYARDCQAIFGRGKILAHSESIGRDVDEYAHEEVLKLYDLSNVPRPALDDRRANCVWAVVTRPSV